MFLLPPLPSLFSLFSLSSRSWALGLHDHDIVGFVRLPIQPFAWVLDGCEPPEYNKNKIVTSDYSNISVDVPHEYISSIKRIFTHRADESIIVVSQD